MTANDRGFTVIEVMVAVVVITIGLLGLTSTSASVVQMVGNGGRFSEVSEMAAEHFEAMRTRPCDQLADSTAYDGAFVVEWAVDSIAGGEGRRIDMTVQSPTPKGSRVDRFSMSVSCRI
jgi:prepilin-type N-terminal cleavage/methylation domain-containing protein